MSRGRRGERGFTLVEVIIALAIVGALLVIAFGGLRVATSAWQQGEDRAEAHQHTRSVALILARAMSGAYPYRATRKGAAPVSSGAWSLDRRSGRLGRTRFANGITRLRGSNRG